MNNKNLYSLFESRFPADRRRPLLILDDGTQVSYADADAGSARYASLLSSRRHSSSTSRACAPASPTCP
jgi:hypothetical protein